MKSPARQAIAEAERAELERMASGHGVMPSAATRARAVLMAADGLTPTDIAQCLSASASTVRRWRGWYQTGGLAGLLNGRPRSPRLAIAIADPALHRLALTHRSYLHEHQGEPLESNERLEFLGDAFLGLVIAEELYRRFPVEAEGRLTEMRSRLVRTETLAELAKDLGVGEALYLGRGEELSGGRSKERNLARGLEALIGALLLDQGHARAKKKVLRLFASLVEGLTDETAKDYKSLLQQQVQAHGGRSPSYLTVSAEGPDHTKRFTVEARVDDRVLGSGVGQSKRKAEQEAARAALAAMGVARSP